MAQAFTMMHRYHAVAQAAARPLERARPRLCAMPNA